MATYASREATGRQQRRAAAQCSLVLLLVQIPLCAENLTLTARVTLMNPAARRITTDNSNAVIWLTPLAEAAGASQQPDAGRAPGVRQPVQLRQKNKRFLPHVLVVPVGQVVKFPNLDPFFHNVFSLFEGKRFDLGLYEAGTTRSVRFNTPGICYIFCNIHPEMSAVIVVLNTPYFGVSDRSGAVRIPDVPAGRYELHVWHERALPEALKSLVQEVTLTSAAYSLGNIRLTESADLLASHKNKYGRDYDRATPSSPLYEQP